MLGDPNCQNRRYTRRFFLPKRLILAVTLILLRLLYDDHLTRLPVEHNVTIPCDLKGVCLPACLQQ